VATGIGASAAGPGKMEIHLRDTWPGCLTAATTEVFSMMVGAEVIATEGAELRVIAEVTGVVGIAGAFRAILSLRCSTSSAVKIAAQMLGIPPEEAAGQRADAIGEICNIVAGHFKDKIGFGDKCMLTVPTVVEGKDYRIVRPGGECEKIEIAFLYEGEPFRVALETRK
jgi:chemotaxis protein CheX